MSTHSVSAMTGLKAPQRRAKHGPAKVVDARVSDLATALESGQAVLDATVRLANALRTSRKAVPIAAKAAPAKKSSPKPSSKASTGAISAKGWHPAKVTDAPDTFQGKGDTV